MPNQEVADLDTKQLARDLYRALAEGDAETLRGLLHPSSTGRATEGLPLGLGGAHAGPER